ncbi:MAG: 2-C-methyl-D-erythritol 2,4-cyclodiphosphate synthase [Actinomycetota bacterium]|nr:2-C-methyl-D-erythritol 2,4-cyclodiphosphate synthase [Actinomycetota bacterium]
MRVGQGYDIHRFTAGDHVWLCGVKIPHSRGILAHSDGDIPLHALCDALLGAAALGDIGRHFPDTDPRWKSADSRALLRHVVALLADRGFSVGNADVTIVAQAPKVAPHVAAMCANLAADLGVGLDRVNVKATTNEKLDAIGREEGIAAFAAALIVRHAG